MEGKYNIPVTEGVVALVGGWRRATDPPLPRPYLPPEGWGHSEGWGDGDYQEQEQVAVLPQGCIHLIQHGRGNFFIYLMFIVIFYFNYWFLKLQMNWKLIHGVHGNLSYILALLTDWSICPHNAFESHLKLFLGFRACVLTLILFFKVLVCLVSVTMDEDNSNKGILIRSMYFIIRGGISFNTGGSISTSWMWKLSPEKLPFPRSWNKEMDIFLIYLPVN